MIVKRINNESSLINNGFIEKEYIDTDLNIVRRGFIKNIDTNTPKDKYILFIPSVGDITGIISYKMYKDDYFSYEEFIKRMKYRSEKQSEDLNNLINNFISSNDIEIINKRGISL